jgi:hypothetical protein
MEFAMRQSKIITSFMFAFITNVSASSLLEQSDVANVKLPSSFAENGVKYTTPALQGMATQHIDMDYVRGAIKDHLPELAKANFLKVDHICMLFRRSDSESPIELSSIWRND